MATLTLKADFLQAVEDMAAAGGTARTQMLEAIIREAAAARQIALPEYECVVCNGRFDSGMRERRPRSGVALLCISEQCYLEWGRRCARQAKQKDRAEADRRADRARCVRQEPNGRNETSRQSNGMKSNGMKSNGMKTL